MDGNNESVIGTFINFPYVDIFHGNYSSSYWSQGLLIVNALPCSSSQQGAQLESDTFFLQKNILQLCTRSHTQKHIKFAMYKCTDTKKN